jgi:glyoxylase-like metal-dependent hydrolase (beta-lactamase superfamily II)
MIPYVRQMAFDYGRPDQVSPLIRRVIANNPGPFTFRGTGTYIVGRGEVAVIDPGPADADHLDALRRAVEGERVTAILVTHDHADHAPLAAALAAATGAPILGCEPHPGRQAPAQGVEEGVDPLYRPGRVLSDGETVAGPGWTLRVLATPGHTSNHLCLALAEENALFSGDHVMGWSTTVVIPPDGNMTQYYDSLRKVIAGGFATLWPTHGPPVTDPEPFLQAYLDHRLRREAQVLAVLARGPTTIDALVGELYVGLDPRLKRAAAASMLAHVLHLVRTGQVMAEGDPGLESTFALNGTEGSPAQA